MKKFYQTVSCEACPEGYRILLDDKPLNTPAKHPVIVPNESMAEAVAEEWRHQGDTIDKHALPLTGYVSLTRDVVIPRRQEVVEELLEYGETDLLFYREDRDESLEERQRDAWQPWLEWASLHFHTHYHLASGIMPVSQPEENRAKHALHLDGLSPWKLALLASVVKASTSLILSFAFLEKSLNAEELLALSTLEEAFNREKWGEDAEAAARIAQLAQTLQDAEKWRDMLP